MPNYKLLTPGPLTTTDTVKKEMLFDHCTWDDDYKKITLSIREKLLKLAHVSEPEYTVVLMQGSGTFGVESVLTSVIGKEDTLLIAANGAYGERMGDIARHAGIHYLMYEEDYNKIPSAEKIREILAEHPEITHVSMVHSETTSGILNDIASVAKVVKGAGKTFIVDAMSSFGGVDIPVGDLEIDFIIRTQVQEQKPILFLSNIFSTEFLKFCNNFGGKTIFQWFGILRNQLNLKNAGFFFQLTISCRQRGFSGLNTALRKLP